MDNYYNEINKSLSNYWTFNSNLRDLITGASLINPVNITFTSDKSGTYSNAISLNYGSICLPSGIYFDGDFTLALWIKVRSIPSSYTKIVDFNSLYQTDYVSLYLSNSTVLMPYLTTRRNNGTPSFFYTNKSMDLNKWYHLAFLLKSIQYSYFI